jgi:hypothetical protein
VVLNVSALIYPSMGSSTSSSSAAAPLSVWSDGVGAGVCHVGSTCLPSVLMRGQQRGSSRGRSSRGRSSTRSHAASELGRVGWGEEPLCR